MSQEVNSLVRTEKRYVALMPCEELFLMDRSRSRKRAG